MAYTIMTALTHGKFTFKFVIPNLQILICISYLLQPLEFLAIAHPSRVPAYQNPQRIVGFCNSLFASYPYRGNRWSSERRAKLA